MLLTRLGKLKIVSAILLPYLVLALGSGFLHNHGPEGSASCAVAHVNGHPGIVCGSELSDANSRHRDCPACSWEKSNLSVPLLSSVVECVCAVTGVSNSPLTPGGAGSVRLAASRAPPA